MKILQVVTGLQKASGVTTFVEGVVPELVKLGHEVDVLTKASASQQDIDISSYDAVHVHGLWSAWLHKIASQAKVVVWSTHGMTAPWSLKHKWWKKFLYWWLVQKPDLKRAAVVHSTVEKEKEWNAALGLKRHVVAPLGTHLKAVEDRKNNGVYRTLLFVGRIYPVKAIDRLIEAFARANVAGWKLRIVGPDQAGHMAELKMLVEKLRCEGSVEFIGPRFGAELDAEYAHCDILALVSHTENFGATVVDALAHGKPVITSTMTPWKIVADVGCGWWVDNDVESLADTFRQALNADSLMLDRMGAKGRAIVEARYTWASVAKQLERAYVQAAGGRCLRG